MAEQNERARQEPRYDVFISYAHVDNKVSKGEGWVTKLHEALKIRLDQLRGEESKIWRDEKLQGNDIFADEIIAVLDRSDIFVSILTPRYTKSSWCNKELDTYLSKMKRLGATGSYTNKTTIFKVIKTPVEPEEEPPFFRQMLGFPFVKEGSQPPVELYPAWSETADREVTAKINDLALTIKKTLKIIRGKASLDEQSGKGNVYLAETASDLNETRSRLVRELEEHGYSVLPDTVLSRTVSGVKEQVKKDLNNSLCSIHLVGNHYGFVPENDLNSGPEDHAPSAVELQVDLAAVHSRGNDAFFQLIWLSSEDNCKAAQRVFREKITNLELQHTDDLLEASYQDLKNEILEKLTALHEASTSAAEEGPNPVIYLLYTREDRKDVKGLRHFIKEKNYEVLKPVFDGSKDEIASLHLERLDLADGVLLFWGKGDEAWFEGQCDTLRNLVASTQEGKRKEIGIILADPENVGKEEFLEDNQKSCVAQLMEGFGSLPDDSLADLLSPFLEKIKVKGNG